MSNVEDTILDPEVHKRLLMDIEQVCAVANVPRQFVHKSMKTPEFHCSKVDIEWVKNFHVHRQEGKSLLLTGKHGESRCMAIAGALVRNFIDARIVSVNQLIAASSSNSKESIPDPTVLVIPNLFVPTHGKAMTGWQVQALYDILLARLIANRPTVAYVDSAFGITEAYGTLFADHLTNNYIAA